MLYTPPLFSGGGYNYIIISYYKDYIYINIRIII